MLRFAPAVLALALIPAVASADPLRLVPKDAGLVVVVENPRKLAEAVRDLDAYQSAQSLPAVREFLDSTTARRFFQLVSYYERELGAKWPEVLDKIAGGGVALGTQVGMDPAPALLVAQGTDEAASAEFFQLAIAALEQETARQSAGGEAPAAKVRRAVRNGVETVHLGDEFHAARVGSVLYVSNKEAALNAGLDLKPGKSVADRAGPKAARKLLGGDPLAWLWLDFAKIKEGKQAKDFFAATRKDLFQTLIFGSSADAFRRADFVAAGLHRTADGFTATVRLPAKRADLHADLALHAPPPDKPGTLPLLEPKGVIYSQSFYLDLGALWKQRKTLINEQQLKDIEEGEKQVSKFIPGPSVGKLLEMSGPYHRLVAVRRDEKPYSVTPDQAVPPFALVSSMRDPQFGKSAASAMRAGAMLATFQAGLSMSEETHDGVTITTYRFPEKKPFPGDGDPDNLRFNFVPCFAVVGDFLVVSSSPALVKDLIPELRKTPDQAVPPFALVSSMRDPQFGKSAASAMRAGAMLATFQAGLSMSEEKHDGVTITTYRFPEKKPFPGDGDPDNLRFNFVPCFAVIGDFLVVSSSPALVKELIPELKKTPDPAKTSSAVWRAKAYAAGLAQTIRDNPEPVVTNAVLSEGVGLDEAKRQVAALADWVATLGAAGLSIDHGPDAYEIKLEWKTGK